MAASVERYERSKYDIEFPWVYASAAPGLRYAESVAPVAIARAR
jgi:hypothetical protein